jgi:hypothetical protein
VRLARTVAGAPARTDTRARRVDGDAAAIVRRTLYLASPAVRGASGEAMPPARPCALPARSCARQGRPRETVQRTGELGLAVAARSSRPPPRVLLCCAHEQRPPLHFDNRRPHRPISLPATVAGVAVSLARESYRGARHPAARASASVQNHLSPFDVSIWV